MAKKFYVLDEQGTVKSGDGRRSYRVLDGETAYAFIHSPHGRNIEFMKCEDEYGNEIGIEVPPENLAKYRREKNREDYLRQVQEEMGISIVSFDSVIIDGEEMSGEEAIPDEAMTAEELLMVKEERRLLKDALRALPKEEFYIIKGLFFDKPKKTEKSLGVELGVSQPAIHKKKMEILKKLKNILTQ